jgi:hypothetical protein
MSFWVVGNGSGFHQILIDSDESDGVSARDIRNVFYGSAHHQHGSLDGLFEQVFLLAWLVVWSHDSDFLPSGDDS